MSRDATPSTLIFLPNTMKAVISHRIPSELAPLSSWHRRPRSIRKTKRSVVSTYTVYSFTISSLNFGAKLKYVTAVNRELPYRNVHVIDHGKMELWTGRDAEASVTNLPRYPSRKFHNLGRFHRSWVLFAAPITFFQCLSKPCGLPHQDHWRKPSADCVSRFPPSYRCRHLQPSREPTPH